MSSEVFGIVSPHPPIFVPKVGGDEALTASRSLGALDAARVALASFAPGVIVLISPHAPLLADAFLVDTSDRMSGSLSAFGDSDLYAWPGDRELALRILDRLDTADLPAMARDTDPRLQPGALDHATIVPLSFLEPTQSVPLVVLSLSFRSYADHRTLGEVVRECCNDLGREAAFVASGDMSHRLKPGAAAGYSPRAKDLDARIIELVQTGRLDELSRIDPDLIEAGGECGLRSIIALGGYAGEDPVPSRVLAYEGPWGVGYLTAAVGEAAVAAIDRQAIAESGRKGGTAGKDESEIVCLARRTIEGVVRSGTLDAAPSLTGEQYPWRAGAFVSLHRDGMLRGCIGTIQPTRPTLAEEVAANAIQAALHDPRFRPLAEPELADLDVKVDVLQPPESCTLSDLDPSRYGVIVTNGGRRGLLLPDLEGVDDVATQVSIAMQKAGISPGESCEIERFRVDRYT